MTWQALEKKVREIANARWDCNAITETIAGVKCDCVLKYRPDNWILVEITQEHNIDKVRNDILKLRTVKNDLYTRDDIQCNCYIVMRDTPTDSMRAAGNAAKIKVMSVSEFQNEYFDYSSYVNIRNRKQFGSLINLDTGEPENNVYINVAYRDKKTGNDYYIQDIIDLLIKGKKIVLKGDFGLGKSRCIKQLFDSISNDPINNPYVLAINLRDHWGMKRGIEILRRHFEELGLEYKNFIKTYECPNAIYLLDGLDEIGAQSWSTDIKIMQHNREISVCAVKDLIQKAQGGILVAGREYYFNSDEEMCRCLGLSEKNVVILDCNQEFSEAEIVDFIQKNMDDTDDTAKMEQLPAWLPRRPLVMQMLLKYASDIFSVDNALDDIYNFWNAFLTKVCEREATIYAALNPDIIRQVLVSLANKTRISKYNVGPITFAEMSDSFREVTGFTPNDESSIMLQRMPTLGRVSADSPDRQFLDMFFLNGLRAEYLIQLPDSPDNKAYSLNWHHPLDQTGLSILASYIEQANSPDLVGRYIGLARRAAESGNGILASDIVAALCLLNISSIDFKDLFIIDGHFSYLSFDGKEVKRLTIQSTAIDKLDLTNAKLADSVNLKDCLIDTIYGIASHTSINHNNHFQQCVVENVEPIPTATLIKKARLSEQHKIFIGIVKKIFFQPGAGKKESTLYRGSGNSVNKPLIDNILRILIDEKLVFKHKGKEGMIYSPERSETGRMKRIMSDLTLSTDSLWERIGKLRTD